MLPILTIDSPILVSQLKIIIIWVAFQYKNIQNTIKDKMCCLNAIGDLMPLLGTVAYLTIIHNL